MEKDKFVFKVMGVSCNYCAIEVQKIFKDTEGFQSVEVNPKENTVTVYTDKRACYSEEQLKKLFDGSGFSFQGIISKPKRCS